MCNCLKNPSQSSIKQKELRNCLFPLQSFGSICKAFKSFSCPINDMEGHRVCNYGNELLNTLSIVNFLKLFFNYFNCTPKNEKKYIQ